MKIKDELLISAVSVDMIPIMWPIVFGMLEEAVDHSNGELDMETIFTKMVKQEMILVVISEDTDVIAAIALERRNFDSGKRILNVTLAGGTDMNKWVDQLDRTLVELAKEHKCDDIYIIGRRGWVKVLKSRGYGIIHTVVGKQVEEL